MSYTQADIEACADHLGKLSLAAKMRERELDSRFPDEIAKIAKNASQWIADDEANPDESLAAIYRQTAQYWGSPELIGYFVTAFLDRKITGVLEARIENGK